MLSTQDDEQEDVNTSLNHSYRGSKAVSCQPCRIRKLKCDRAFPCCSACQRRGIPEQCRQSLGHESHGQSTSSSKPSLLSSSKRKRPTWERTDQRHRDATRGSELNESAFAGCNHFNLETSLVKLRRKDPGRWRTCLLEALRLLPDREEFQILFDYYLQHIEPVLNCVNSILMHEEIEMLYKNVDALRLKNCNDTTTCASETRGSVIDSCPSFWADDRHLGLLSVAYAITYFVYDSMQLTELQDKNLMLDCKDREDTIALMEQVYAQSEYHLRESEFDRNPTLWSIQAIILQQRRHFRMKDFSAATSWHSRAVQVAQVMGLNRLGETKADLEYLRGKTEHPPSPELFLMSLGRFQAYKQNDAARREVARKVWTTLVSHDWLCAIQLDLTLCVSEAMNNTSLPAMLSDNEVLSLATLPLETVKASHESSANKYLEIKMLIATNARLLCEACCQSIARIGVPFPDYEIIERIDENLRGIISELPKHLGLEYSKLHCSASEPLRQENTRVVVQQLMLHETLQHLLLSLHTIYLKSGLADIRYQRSVVGCIDAASNLLTIWAPLQLYPIGNSPQLKWHLLLAGGALAYVVGAKIAHGETDSMKGINLDATQGLLETATECLEGIRSENNLGPYGLDYSVSTLRQYCRVHDAKSLREDRYVNPSDSQPDQVSMPDLDNFLQGLHWLDANGHNNQLFLPDDNSSHNPNNDSCNNDIEQFIVPSNS